MKITSIGMGFLVAAALCGQAGAVETDYAAGTMALPLQQSGGTARAMAMGSAVVGVSQGAASLLWNPAGLGRMDCKEVSLHHNSGLGGTIQEIGIIGLPLGKVKEQVKEECSTGGSLGGLAASLGYVNYGAIPGADASGNGTGNYNAGEYSGSLGWGKTFFSGLSAGIAARANKSSLADTEYYAYTTDVGLLWNVVNSLDLGVTYSNLNIGKKIGGSQLASGLRLGAGWKVYRHWLLAASGEMQRDNAINRIQMGTEYIIGNIDDKGNDLFLRAGYQLNYPDPQLDGLTGLTMGLGYTLSRNLALDYAFMPTGELGNSHRLSVTYKFGCPKKPKPPVVAAAPAPAVAAAEPSPYVAEVAPIVAAAPIVLKSIILEDSHFDFNKTALRPEGMAALRENVELLKENPETRVRVAGYTSLRGKAEYNQQLSERRAAAVESFLVTEGGIAPSRISTIGYGETNPAAYEASASKKNMNSPAAKANMRVLFEVIVK